MTPRKQQVKIEDILELVVKNYIARGQRSVDDVRSLIRLHILPYFGGRVAERILTSEIDDYVAHRLNQKAAMNSIHYELSILRRGYNLARRDLLLERMPMISTPKSAKADPRTDYFDHDEYLRFMFTARQLGEDLIADIVLYTYSCGWRFNEVLGLHKNMIRVKDRIAELPKSKHKNKEKKIFPLEGEVWTMIERRLQSPSLEGFLFHRNGKPVKFIRGTWANICKRALIGHKTFHALRRSCRTNLGLAGIDDQIGMRITGHLDKETYDQYNQVALNRLRDAVRKVNAYLESEAAQVPSQPVDSIRESHVSGSGERPQPLGIADKLARMWQRIAGNTRKNKEG